MNPCYLFRGHILLLKHTFEGGGTNRVTMHHIGGGGSRSALFRYMNRYMLSQLKVEIKLIY